MNKRFIYILLALYIPLMSHNIYLLFSGEHSKYQKVEIEGGSIYKVITKTLKEMNGEVVKTVGKIVFGFTVEVKFSNVDNYQREPLFHQLMLLGFSLKEATPKWYLLCKGNAGISISEKKMLVIEYSDKMNECKN